MNATRACHSRVVGIIFLALIAIVPMTMLLIGKPFWLDVFTRLVILAIAATSLHLLIGVAGLASLGHAAYLGIGAYAVGIPVYHETYGGPDWISSYNGWIHLVLAISVCALFAFITGAISLRTKGVHFIMITMAFSQMVYYALISLEEYGGDDGLSVDIQSEIPGLPLDEPIVLFCVCYISLLIVLYFMHRLTHSRFGRVLQASRQNEVRVSSLGVDPYRYQLLAFVMAGCIAGYAGVLMANFSLFISPSIVEWSRSGELMFMIILGGLSSLVGPVIGAAAFVLLEYALSRITIYWHLPFGLLLLFIVMSGRGGVVGMLRSQGKRAE